MGDEASTDVVVWDTQTGTLVKRIPGNIALENKRGIDRLTLFFCRSKQSGAVCGVFAH